MGCCTKLILIYKEEIEIHKNIKEIILLSGAYISVCIGSGFATGQEILQFFSSQGSNSILAGILCMLIMMYSGAKLLKIGKNSNLKYSNDIFTHLFGSFLGNIFKILIPVFCLCSFIVMISGAGATLNQYYGINKTVGGSILAIITMISVIKGMDKVLSILGSLGPIIAIVAIGVSIITISNNYENLRNVDNIVYNLNMVKAVDSWPLSALVYSGLNIIFATPFLAGAGKTVKNIKNCKYAGILGGFILIAAAMFINIALLTDIQNVYIQEIPTLYIAKQISNGIGNIFSLILIGGIYTTAAPLLWNVCSSCYVEKTKEFNLMAILCTVLGIFGGMLPFSYLVNFMYPISGSVGIIIIIFLIVKRR
ncbi:YkvI family membrane protein [Paraclostridium bifermentans]|uniref:YkvI family membrane protein n=2 Tax=Paraclostridium bifermentans TaxID=1490 RepID=UPI00359C140A